MRLTRQSEIAIGVLAACAERPGEQVQTVRLAEITRTTKAHAARIVALLVRYGYLKSIRGRSGGLRLLADPSRIALGDVLRLTQPELADIATIRKPDTLAVKATFDVIVQAAFASFFDMIDRFTVADLVALSPSGRMACLDCSLLNPARRPRVAAARPSTSLPPRDCPRAALPPRANRNQAESIDRHALRPVA